jgi:hypothetical protein
MTKFVCAVLRANGAQSSRVTGGSRYHALTGDSEAQCDTRPCEVEAWYDLKGCSRKVCAARRECSLRTRFAVWEGGSNISQEKEVENNFLQGSLKTSCIRVGIS